MAANTIDLNPFLIESSAAAAEIVGGPPHLNILIEAAVKIGLVLAADRISPPYHQKHQRSSVIIQPAANIGHKRHQEYPFGKMNFLLGGIPDKWGILSSLAGGYYEDVQNREFANHRHASRHLLPPSIEHYSHPIVRGGEG